MHYFKENDNISVIFEARNILLQKTFITTDGRSKFEKPITKLAINNSFSYKKLMHILSFFANNNFKGKVIGSGIKSKQTSIHKSSSTKNRQCPVS